MHRTTKLLATTMIAAAGAITAALTLSATAAAEPAAPPTIPGTPGLPFIDQLASAPALAPQLLQSLASVLAGGGSTAAPPPEPLADVLTTTAAPATGAPPTTRQVAVSGAGASTARCSSVRPPRGSRVLSTPPNRWLRPPARTTPVQHISGPSGRPLTAKTLPENE